MRLRDTDPSTESPRSPSLKEYENVAGFTESDFENDWQRETSIYREILWAMISEYAHGQCEMTHSEFIKDKKTGTINAISLCVTIFEDSGYNFRGLADFIQRNVYLIPAELRISFIAYIGYNYGEAGGVEIEGNQIKFIDQQTLNSEALESDGQIGHKGMDKLQNIYLDVIKNIEEAENS